MPDDVIRWRWFSRAKVRRDRRAGSRGAVTGRGIGMPGGLPGAICRRILRGLCDPRRPA